MAVTQIDIDDDALDRGMTPSKARTKKDAVNLDQRYYMADLALSLRAHLTTPEARH